MRQRPRYEAGLDSQAELFAHCRQAGAAGKLCHHNDVEQRKTGVCV